MAKKNNKKSAEKKPVTSGTKVRVITSSEADDKPKKDSKKVSKDIKVPKKLKKIVKVEKEKTERHLPKPIAVVFGPLFAIGRYFRDSWHELRQVRWTTRRATWKMTFAVIAYTVFFFVLVALIDALFTFLFNKVLG